MQRLLLLGLNHTTAPLEVREKLAFNNAQRRAAIEAFLARFHGCEAVLLSTCNRVELYVGRDAHGAPAVEEMSRFLSEFHGLQQAAFQEHLYLKTDRAVIEHLFAVASSLDSMVLGETQILGQVRDAYETSLQLSATGPSLNPLFQRAVAVGKRVLTETALAEGRISVASVAVDYAQRIFEHFGDKTVLCIGAGKMAILALKGFEALSPRELLVCNRDPDKAIALAQRFRGRAVPFVDLPDHLVSADIVVSSTGSQQPIITRELFEGLRRRRRYRPVFLIDIAVPRDIEQEVSQIENVYLYNLDDLQQVVAGTQSQRREAIDAARAIVTRHVEEFAVWHRQREMGPVIDRLYRRYHRLAQEELTRTLGKTEGISQPDRAQLEEMTRRIVNKLLHTPVHTLRRSERLGTPTAQSVHALEKLFWLDEHEENCAAEPDEGDAAPQTPRQDGA